jgi:hypothetical protein
VLGAAGNRIVASTSTAPPSTPYHPHHHPPNTTPTTTTTPAAQVVRTVERLHARGVVHFDLKGENVLLRPAPGPETGSGSGSGTSRLAAAGRGEEQLWRPPQRAGPPGCTPQVGG